MGLFSRKTKTDAVEFARGFYDEFVFGPDPTGGDLTEVLAETTRRLVSQAAPSFAEVSLTKLTEELRALRLEMIGTAWTHRLKPEVAITISEFTKQYLTTIDRADLWQAMTDYNQAVAQSATISCDRSSRVGRDRITFVNLRRANLFDKWVDQGRDPEAAARVANRVGSDASWKACVTQPLVAVRLTQRVDFEGSDPVWQRLAAVAHGFYQGAQEALGGVRLAVQQATQP
jgi:hypothetical protein